MKKSVKRSLAIGAGVLVVVGGAWGYTTLKGATPDIDPSKLATVERGTMTRSVVATGKIEPITKVEIKSKANGIIERLNEAADRDLWADPDPEVLAAMQQVYLDIEGDLEDRG